MLTATNTFESETDAKLSELQTKAARLAQRLGHLGQAIEKAQRQGLGHGHFLAEQAELQDELNFTLTDLRTTNVLYTGWSRFFLVTNTNGHIHSSMNCNTCFDTTQYAWITVLSGLTEAEAVASQGEILCSICFPSAPVEWTNGISKASQEAKDERAAKKAAAAAKKIEKALVPDDVDGGYLANTNSRFSERIKTVHAAKEFLTGYFDWKDYNGEIGYTHPSYQTHDALAIADLLVGRPGVPETTPEAVLAAAEKRSAKRKG